MQTAWQQLCSRADLEAFTVSCALQAVQLLWNLFELAADTANQVVLPGSSDPSTQQQGEQLQQQQEPLPDTQQEQQQQRLQEQEKHQQAPASCCSHQGVAGQLVDVLAAALQQQVATCSSLQVRWCCHVRQLPSVLDLFASMPCQV